MYTGLKHLHVLLIALFVISVLIKTILLFVNEEKFDKYRKKTKTVEMVITMLFLVTGVIMISMRGFNFHFTLHIKFALIIIAIPLAIVGFKKKNKALAFIATSLFIMTYGVAEMSSKKMKEVHVELPVTDINYGKALYEGNCTTCHGDKGASQINGATDLSSVDLSIFAISETIKNGSASKKMSAFRDLDSLEVNAISNYVLTLKAK
jgi:mono/diheme cytochrome c family protein